MGVDHLVYAVPVLEDGMDRMEVLLGVRPVLGGRHPAFGTHNALLSLGASTYLEIIAPDPELPRPERGLVFGMDGITEPRLATWALCRDDIETGAARAAALGVSLGEIGSGSRDRIDGVRLSWRLTDPFAMPMDGVVPFLISWGDTPHPSASAPRCGSLAGLGIWHPRPQQVRDVLAALDAPVAVVEAGSPRVEARILTAGGMVTL